VAGALGLVFWIIAARQYNDADIGFAATVISSATFLATLSTLGFNISLVRFIPEGKLPVTRLINSAVTIASIVAVLLAVAFGGAALAWLPLLGAIAGSPPVLVLFAFFTAVWTVYFVFDAAFIGLGAARYVLVRAVIYNVLKIGFPFALAASLSIPIALFSAWGLGLLVANIVAATVLFRSVVPAFRLRPALDRNAVAGMVRFSLANHATNVLGAAQGLVFPLLVLHALGARETGYFYIAWVLASLLYIVPGSIFTSVLAEGSRWRPGLPANALDGLFLSLALLVPGVAGVLLLGPSVLGALSPNFLAAVPVLNVLGASSFFVAFNSLFASIRRVEKRMRPVVGLYAGAALLAIVLAWPLLLTAGLIGVGIAFAVAQGVGAAYCLWSLAREGALRRQA
jgi:O-antigen/teichoic acid export membrane protein